VLVLVPLWTHRRLVSGGAAIGWRAWLAFFGIVALVNMPWYVAVCFRHPEFVRYFLWQHHVERFVDPFDHVRPVWFYLPLAGLGLLPAIVFLRPLWRFFLSTNPQASANRCPVLGYLILAGTWCIFFFSLAGSKLPTYVLPAFPPLCLALGCFVARTEVNRSRWLLGLVAACWLLLAASHYVVLPGYARQKSPSAQLDEVAAMCGDREIPVFCFPRNVDSLAFYLGRCDFRTYRSKQLNELIHALEQHPRAVVLFGHRSSAELLQCNLPPHLRMMERRPLGLCEMAVVTCSCVRSE
jgi:hypothetical protein